VQVVDLLVPSQANPGGQGEHVVRVAPSAVPPEVMNPAAHVEQDVAAPALNLLSLPHCVHVALPAPLNVPVGHAVGPLLPEHTIPALQRSQPVCVVDVPPVV
jgi:hypothetical protein